MGNSQKSLFSFKTKHLIISIGLLLISSFTHNTSMAQDVLAGRAIPNAVEVIKGREEKLRERAVLIGSRPPTCVRMCSNGVHCKAIQVPIVPHLKPTSKIHSRVPNSKETLNSRTDNLSNYKPMRWKCKCGNLILNP